mmetsp:Transcript_29385/g.73361  ORF Transcript_29385/g.73361 Transcript_29385/m.73361 type:complete len:245 (+) Transcript_29385:1383-2117(+)
MMARRGGWRGRCTCAGRLTSLQIEAGGGGGHARHVRVRAVPPRVTRQWMRRRLEQRMQQLWLLLVRETLDRRCPVAVAASAPASALHQPPPAAAALTAIDVPLPALQHLPQPHDLPRRQHRQRSVHRGKQNQHYRDDGLDHGHEGAKTLAHRVPPWVAATHCESAAAVAAQQQSGDALPDVRLSRERASSEGRRGDATNPAASLAASRPKDITARAVVVTARPTREGEERRHGRVTHNIQPLVH